MGGNSSKTAEDQPRMVVKNQKKHVYVLVLHKKSQQTQPVQYKLRDAFDGHPLNSSYNVDYIEIEIPDDDHLPELKRNEIETEISKRSRPGCIVLTCLLSDCYLECLKKTIVFSFKDPPVTRPSICIDVNLQTATPIIIRSKLDVLVAAVKEAFCNKK